MNVIYIHIFKGLKYCFGKNSSTTHFILQICEMKICNTYTLLY